MSESLGILFVTLDENNFFIRILEFCVLLKRIFSCPYFKGFCVGRRSGSVMRNSSLKILTEVGFNMLDLEGLNF